MNTSNHNNNNAWQVKDDIVKMMDPTSKMIDDVMLVMLAFALVVFIVAASLSCLASWPDGEAKLGDGRQESAGKLRGDD